MVAEVPSQGGWLVVLNAWGSSAACAPATQAKTQDREDTITVGQQLVCSTLSCETAYCEGYGASKALATDLGGWCAAVRCDVKMFQGGLSPPATPCRKQAPAILLHTFTTISYGHMVHVALSYNVVP